MKILQVLSCGELKFGGPPQRIFTLSDALARRGHDVHLASYHSDHPEGLPDKAQGAWTIHYLGWWGRGLLQWPRQWRRLRRLVRQSDVVHLYGIYNLLCPLAALLARLEGKPFLLEPVGMFVPRIRKVRAKELYHRLFTFPMARAAHRVVATSPHEQNELAPLASDAPAKLLLRRNGFDLAAFQRLPSPEAFRKRLGLRNERIVLFVGRISPIKNLEALVRAFVAADLPDTRLLLVGPELEKDYSKHLRAVLEELNVGERIRLVGELYGDDKLAALAAADVVALPSINESFGNAAAEGVAAGVPVLVSTGCGIAPHVHERAGLAVERDVASIRQGLEILLDPQKRAPFVARRDEVLRELSLDEPLDLTEEVYAAVRAERRAARSARRLAW